MAKKRLILTALYLSLWLLLFGDIVTIGSGDILHQGLPIEPMARFSYTQQIILASEINHPGMITSIGFQYLVSSNSFLNGNNSWKIFLGHTTQSQLSEWIPATDLVTCFNGILDTGWFSGGLPGNGWVIIPLSNPFNYNGNQNLVIAVDENTDAAGNSSDDFYCSSKSVPRGISFQSMTVNPDPQNPPATFQLKNYLSNVMLTFGNSDTPDAPQNLYGYFDGNTNRLFWTAPTTPGVISYRINRNNLFLQDCTTLSFSDTEIIAGFTYSYNVQARYADNTLSGISNVISITVPMGGDNCILYEGFEACEAFSGTIPRFTNLDLDGSSTWTWQDTDFPGEGSPMGWLSFVPSLTTPPFTLISPAQGTRMLMAMSSITPPNNDWLISPRLHPGTQAELSFKARSATTAYGLERLRVLVGTDINNLGTFTPLHNEAYLSIPALWTDYEYSLSAYSDQSIYLAWQCVSLDAFALFLDEIMLTGTGGYLGSEDPLNPPPRFLNYPNPSSSGSFQIKSMNDQPFDLSIYNIRGQKIHSCQHLKSYNSLESQIRLPAGIYILRLDTGTHSTTLRQVILP